MAPGALEEGRADAAHRFLGRGDEKHIGIMPCLGGKSRDLEHPTDTSLKVCCS